MTVRPECGPAAPYVGLRPFEFHEAALFYGRGEHIAEMVRTLRKKHFLAVVGSSGSGKSSLVRAGMLPAIAAGFMDGGEADLDWRFVIMRPGRDPYENLLSELLPKLAPGQSLDPELIEFRRQTLRGGPRGLLEAVADSLLPEPARLVVLVDQFEEIFRFLERGGPGLSDDGSSLADRRNAALAFVDMLLATAAERDPQVYVVLTMRSEYLGECEAFLGLSTAIASSQFLTPRMTREQIQDIIERPIEAVDGRIEPQVVTDLLNSLGTAQDQLPRVEHILLRMWDQARKARENQPKPDQPISLTLDDYRDAGGFESALDQHAEQLYQELGAGAKEEQPSEKQRVAGHLFRSLAARSSQGALVRRLSSVGEVAAIAGAPEQTVGEVVEHFRQSGCNFLVATPSALLTGKTTLDISHEALLRQWRRLRDWLEAEEKSAEEYVRLAGRAQLRKTDDDLLRGSELERVLEWKEEDPKPTPAWAERYHPGFADAMQFLRESKKARAKQQTREANEQKERRKQKWRSRIVGGALLVIAILTGTTIWVFNEREIANNERAIAKKARASAEKAWAFALWQAGIAHRDQGLGLKASYEFLDAAKTSSDKTQQRNLELAAHFAITGLIRSFPHDDVVGNARYNKKQSRVLSWDKKGAMKLWDMDPTKVEPLREWKNVDDQAHTIPVSGAIFSPDGSHVLSWDQKGVMKLWDMDPTEVEPLREWKNVDDQANAIAVSGVIFSPDGSHVLSWDQKGVMKLWDIKAAKPSRSWKHGKGVAVTGAQFSPDNGSRFLSWDATGAVMLWDIKAAKQTQSWKHNNAVLHAHFAAGSPYVLSWSDDNVMKMWSVKKDKSVAEFKDVPAPSSADSTGDISKDGRLRISKLTLKKVVEFWDTDQASPRRNWTPSIPNIPDIPVTDAIFTRDGSRVFTRNDDGALKLWDTNLALAESDIGIITPTWSDKAVDVSGVIFSPDGSGVLTWDYDGTLKLWDVKNGQHVWKKDIKVTGAIFTPDGSGVLTWDYDRTLKLWDVKEDKLLQDSKTDTIITGATFTLDGSVVLTWNYDTLELWDVKGDELPKVWKTDTKITGAIFTPDGSAVLTWDGDGAVKLWDANEDDSRDEQKAEPLRAWKHDGPITGAIFTHDGLRILSWSIDGVMKMWPLDRGGSIKEWKHATPVDSAQFTKNDASILTWSNSGAGQLQSWDVALRDESLTPAQRIQELKVRSATQLTKAGELVPLSIEEWTKIADEYEKIKPKQQNK